MKVSKHWFVGFLLAATAVASQAQAQAPAQLPVQGYLTETDGTPVDGEKEIAFRLFEVETGGEALFTESQDLLVNDGFFTAYLGDVSELDLALFRDRSVVYLEVVVDGRALTPRILMASVPYAALAQFAEEAREASLLGGLQASELAAATHGHQWSDMSGVPADLADGDDDTLYTAGPGLSMSDTQMSVDIGTIQARVTGVCTAGSAIRRIDAAGAVTCEPDDVGPAYLAGTGLSLAGTTFSVDPAQVQTRVSDVCAAGSAIRAIAPDGAVTCEVDDGMGIIPGIEFLNNQDGGVIGTIEAALWSISVSWPASGYLLVTYGAVASCSGGTFVDHRVRADGIYGYVSREYWHSPTSIYPQGIGGTFVQPVAGANTGTVELWAHSSSGTCSAQLVSLNATYLPTRY